MTKSLSLLLALSLLIAGCGPRDPEPAPNPSDGNDSPPPIVTSDEVNAIIQNIASPIEVAAVIHSLEIPFSTLYLADPGNVPVSATNVEKAFMLGALSADLGYLNIYGKSETTVDYLYGIFQLAGALQIEQFFDFTTIQKMVTSGSDLDSLVYLTTSSFNRMDDYLRETGRSRLSAMMITGVWMEGLYLATQLALDNESEELNTLIGEQKLILDDLLTLLVKYRDDELVVGYIEDLEELRTIYQEVEITYTEGEPETIEEDGMRTVVQSESSDVTISEEILEVIAEVTRQFRNAYLNE